MADTRPTRAALSRDAVASCGTGLHPPARAYEGRPDKRRDLLQEIHVALWQSFEHFEGRCSLKTWVYRIAHNTATSVVIRKKLRAPVLVGLDDVEASLQTEGKPSANEQETLERLWTLVQRLKPDDKQVILLYLEGTD